LQVLSDNAINFVKLTFNLKFNRSWYEDAVIDVMAVRTIVKCGYDLFCFVTRMHGVRYGG